MGSDRDVLPGDTVDGSVVQEVVDCGDVVDDALRYIPSAMFNTFHTLVEISPLYLLKYE